MDLILKNYYVSRQTAKNIITRALTSQKIFGSNPRQVVRQTKFLNIQRKGNSQNDLLVLANEVTESEYGISIQDCGKYPIAYVYLDDCLYSGYTALYDLKKWLPNAIRGTTLHLIFLAAHTSGIDYLKKKFNSEAQRYGLSVDYKKKLAQNWESFGQLLLSTENRPIVEDSHKDNFWGAIPVDSETLVGINALGRLLMELRELLKQPDADSSLRVVQPPTLPNFLLYEEPIGIINMNGNYQIFTEVNQEKLEIPIPEPVNSKAPEENQSIEKECIHSERENFNGNSNLETERSLPKNQDNLAEEKNEYDAFYIMWPYIEKFLTTERKDKELAEIFKVGPKQMKNWLERGVELGKVKKLDKPVRYIAVSSLGYKQLSLSIEDKLNLDNAN
ncbi:MAG: DUF1768 domain-containing protein [Okeania sp. SIO2C2]|nr:DUF1768 domain-containing protein [Okeania sp. SIO2C2]